jgi:hypothetical protein
LISDVPCSPSAPLAPTSSLLERTAKL